MTHHRHFAGSNLVQAAISNNDQARVWAIGGREAWRLSINLVCTGVPYDFGNANPHRYYFIHDYSFSSFNSLKYSWNADYFAALEQNTHPSRSNWTDAERATCANKLVDYVILHIPSIKSRLRVAKRWNTAWEKALTPEFVRWLFSPSNTLKKRGNEAAHEMKREDIVKALRNSVELVAEEDKVFVGYAAGPHRVFHFSVEIFCNALY